MKIALITDTHAGARGESEVFNEYFFKFWEGTFFPYLESNNIKHVIHLGDVVDRQTYITYVIASSWRIRFWNRLRNLGVSVDAIVGNHDAPNNKYSNTPNALIELLQEYDNLRIFDECSLQHYDGIPIALIPWINKGNYDSTMKFIDKVPASLAMGHLELKGFEMDRGNVSKMGLDRELFKKFEIVMSGHYHHRSTDGHIWYLGNTYEITWADYDDPRGFHVFVTDTRELEFIQNPHRMFHKVFYDDSDDGVVDGPDKDLDMEGRCVRVIVTKKTNVKVFDTFVDQIRELKPYRLEIDDQTEVDVTSNAEVSDVKDTLSIINTYVDNSDVTVDKNKLKQVMSDLYKEANGSL